MTNQRRDYFPPDEIVAEAAAALRSHQPGEIDWITFVGSGEPTLHASLGSMIRQLKTLRSLPIAVITNGSLLYLPEVREELLAADAVLPTLDAGTEEMYRKINRPMPELDFDRFVDGLVAFRQQYPGKLWMEVMLVAGLNDSEQALDDLAGVLRRVRPDEVHLNSPDRPPCEPWVCPTDEAGLARAAQILGGVCRVVRPAKGEIDLSGFANVVDAIVAVITRHPVSEEDLIRTLGRWTPGHVQESLADLERSGKAQLIMRGGRRFWSCAEARYVDEELSRCHRGGSGLQEVRA
jgi:wyosine [tRNA(Phe)-imidazoG37] synthetase (radical SAM superfamily)